MLFVCLCLLLLFGYCLCLIRLFCVLVLLSVACGCCVGLVLLCSLFVDVCVVFALCVCLFNCITLPDGQICKVGANGVLPLQGWINNLNNFSTQTIWSPAEAARPSGTAAQRSSIVIFITVVTII